MSSFDLTLVSLLSIHSRGEKKNKQTEFCQWMSLISFKMNEIQKKSRMKRMRASICRIILNGMEKYPIQSDRCTLKMTVWKMRQLCGQLFLNIYDIEHVNRPTAKRRESNEKARKKECDSVCLKWKIRTHSDWIHISISELRSAHLILLIVCARTVCLSLSLVINLINILFVVVFFSGVLSHWLSHFV